MAINGDAILGKLGGDDFGPTTGAYAFERTGTSLSFKLLSKRTLKRINMVEVTVNDARDGYDIRFYYVSKLCKGSATMHKEVIYGDYDLGGSELRGVFSRTTGIDITGLKMA